MPTTYYQNPWAQGLDNITQMIFSNAKAQAQRPLLEAQARHQQALTDSAYATADYNRRRAGALDEQSRAMAIAPEQIATMVFGNQPQAQQFMDYRNTGSWGRDMGESPPDELGGGPPQAFERPAPAWATPDALGRANRTIGAYDVARALPGNDNGAQIAKLVEALYNEELRTRAMNGGVTPTQRNDLGGVNAAIGGKPLYDDLGGGTGTFDQYTGGQTLNPLGNEKVSTERAHQGAYRGAANASNAAAGASSALARQRNAETTSGVKIGAPVVLDDGTYAAPGSAVGKAAGTKPKADADKPRKPLRKDQAEAIVGTIANLAGGDIEDMDPSARAKLVSRATQLATDPNSDYHQDPAGAAEAAVNEVAPQGFEKQGTFGFRKLQPKGGQQGAADGAPKSGAPAAASAGKPKGLTDQQLIEQANQAIKAGKDPKAVRQRLRDWGIQVGDGGV